LFISFAKHIKP